MSGLSCSTWDLSLQPTDSLVLACGLSCSVACWTLVPCESESVSWKCVQLFVTLRTVARQAPLSIGFFFCCCFFFFNFNWRLITLQYCSGFAIRWHECPWDSPGKNTGVGCHFLLQGVFPSQGSNPRPLQSTLQGRFLTTRPPGKPL